MSKDKYVAYVSSYTMGNKFGISIYDVDMSKGRFVKKDQVMISNSSYVTISHNRKFLYSITDLGVEAYRVLAGGALEQINMAMINGMRGCYLSTDYDDRYLFVAGYHDGKITVLSINEDGSIGDIKEEVYLKGMGSIAERNYRPHVECVKMTRDNKYLLAADPGMDHVNVYLVNHQNGKLTLVDIIRCDQESAPRHIKFSKSGEYLYIVNELKNCVDVYRYWEAGVNNPEFEKIQSISTLNEYHSSSSAASALNLSGDFKYLVSSNAGDNSVVVYTIEESGTLKKNFCLPISGSYPKDAVLFPDNKHLVSLNHESDTMTFFSVDIEKGTLVMNGREMEIEKPNCIIFHKL